MAQPNTGMVLVLDVKTPAAQSNVHSDPAASTSTDPTSVMDAQSSRVEPPSAEIDDVDSAYPCDAGEILVGAVAGTKKEGEQCQAVVTFNPIALE